MVKRGSQVFESSTLYAGKFKIAIRGTSHTIKQYSTMKSVPDEKNEQADHSTISGLTQVLYQRDGEVGSLRYAVTLERQNHANTQRMLKAEKYDAWRDICRLKDELKRDGEAAHKDSLAATQRLVDQHESALKERDSTHAAAMEERNSVVAAGLKRENIAFRARVRAIQSLREKLRDQHEEKVSIERKYDEYLLVKGESVEKLRTDLQTTINAQSAELESLKASLTEATKGHLVEMKELDASALKVKGESVEKLRAAMQTTINTKLAELALAKASVKEATKGRLVELKERDTAALKVKDESIEKLRVHMQTTINAQSAELESVKVSHKQATTEIESLKTSNQRLVMTASRVKENLESEMRELQEETKASNQALETSNHRLVMTASRVLQNVESKVRALREEMRPSNQKRGRDVEEVQPASTKRFEHTRTEDV